MRFDVLTLFPDLFPAHLQQGVTRRAFEGGAIDVRLWQLREFATDAYRRVDDRPFGGGPGMVMLVEPLEAALSAILADRAAASSPASTPSSGSPDVSESSASTVTVIHFTPAGRRLDQALVQQLAASDGAVLICGRYEGIDQRVIDRFVTLEISLGDFVLSGGELPALVLMDAVARLQDGVMTAASHQQDSFSDGLLEGPSYSRPEALADGREVPPVLLSGHHAHIAAWRRRESLRLTAERRPDLLARLQSEGGLSKADLAELKRLDAQSGSAKVS